MSTSSPRIREAQPRTDARYANRLPRGESESVAEHGLMLDLLRRGAGVTQILREIAKPGDTATDRLIRASRLRLLIESLAATSDPSTPRLARKFTRTLAYLDRRLALILTEVSYSEPRAGRQPTTDSYGVQVSVTDGLPAFIMIGAPDRLEQLVGADLRRRLGTLWPTRRITVVTPPGWRPSELTLRALAYAIHVEHTY